MVPIDCFLLYSYAIFSRLTDFLDVGTGSQALAQVSWNLTNDLYASAPPLSSSTSTTLWASLDIDLSLCRYYTPLCMQRNHRPHVLACSSLYLAQFILEQSNMEVPQVSPSARQQRTCVRD